MLCENIMQILLGTLMVHDYLQSHDMRTENENKGMKVSHVNYVNMKPNSLCQVLIGQPEPNM